MTGRFVAALAVLLACAALAGAARASDGGSGTYIATGTTYDFTFFNSGNATWQYFYVVGPPGTTFVGGGTISEANPRCAVGEPDGRPDEIECGPLQASLALPRVHFGFVAFVASPLACGAPFQLYVSSTGVPPFTRTDDVPFAGSCAPTPPHAISAPSIAGLPIVGRTLTAHAAVWSATPTRVSYSWQRCSKTRCTAIRGARALKLRLTKPDAGHSVRLVATAVVDGRPLTSRSGKLLVSRAEA